MNSEPRTFKSESSAPHLAITPSELAALLGSADSRMVEPPRITASVPRWTKFSDGLARSLMSRLRPLLRAAVRVTSHGSGLLPAESVIASRGADSVVNLWQPDLSLEPAAVMLSPALIATFVDRILGGGSAPLTEPTEAPRSLTDVDHRLAARLTEAVRASVCEQAVNGCSIELTVLSHATSFVDAWLSDCSLLRLSFELRFVQGGGTFDLLLPREVAERVADAPDDFSPPESPNRALPTAQQRSTLVAQFPTTSLSEIDVAKLAIGDVLLLDSTSNSSLNVFVDGRLQFHAVGGTLAGQKALRLTSVTHAP